VKVFHQATRVPAVDETSTEASRHASTAFIPTFLHEFQANKQGGDRIVLVGRAHRRSSGRSAGSLVGTYQLTNVSRPIGVDLKTLRVCVFNVWLSAPKRQHDSFLSRNGKLIAASGLSVYDQVPIVSPETEAAKTFVRSRRICVNKDGVHFLAWQAAPVCLFHNGFVYAPAQAWFRFDPDTLAEERLVPGALPEPYIRLKHHAVSGHFGIVAWGDSPDSFYKVEVE